jgi:hypothetical protein
VLLPLRASLLQGGHRKINEDNSNSRMRRISEPPRACADYSTGVDNAVHHPRYYPSGIPSEPKWADFANNGDNDYTYEPPTMPGPALFVSRGHMGEQIPLSNAKQPHHQLQSTNKCFNLKRFWRRINTAFALQPGRPAPAVVPGTWQRKFICFGSG